MIQLACQRAADCRCRRVEVAIAAQTPEASKADVPVSTEQTSPARAASMDGWLRLGPTALRRCATHEASHAVAGIVFQGAVLWSTVALDAAGRALTHGVEPVIEKGVDNRPAIVKMAAVKLAGLAVDQASSNQNDWLGSMADIRSANHLVSFWPRCVRTDIERVIRETVDEFVRDGRGAIDKVAEALLRPPYRLEGDEIAALVAQDVPARRIHREDLDRLVDRLPHFGRSRMVDDKAA
jgi:hypothetical protein